MKTSVSILSTVMLFWILTGCSKDESNMSENLRLELALAKGGGTTIAAPSGLFSVAVTTTSIWLSWKDNSSNETGFVVERRSNKSKYTSIVTLSANSTSFQDNSVSSGVTYTYRVKVFNGNISAYSNVITVSTSTNISTGLVAFYPFNGNANDESGNGNNGTVNAGVILTTDRFNISNSAYNFQGGTITIPHKNYLAIPQVGEFSVSLWLKKTGSENPVHIIGKRASGAHEFNWIIGQHTTPGGAPGGGIVFTGAFASSETGIGYNGISDPVLQNNQWDFVVGTYNNGYWKLYKNGNLVAQKASYTYAPDTATPKLEIGNCGNWGAFYGLIDNIRIYSREITQDDIYYLYTH